MARSRRAAGSVSRRPRQSISTVISALHNLDIRRLEIVWALAIGAEWAHFVALGVFAYHHGGTSFVGLAGLVRLLPAGVWYWLKIVTTKIGFCRGESGSGLGGARRLHEGPEPSAAQP